MLALGKFLFAMLMVSIWGYNCMIPSGKVKDKGSIMESAESGGTILWSIIMLSILKDRKDSYILFQKYGGRYFAKVKGIYILSRSMEADTFNKRIGAYGYIL